jgi:La domain
MFFYGYLCLCFIPHFAASSLLLFFCSKFIFKYANLALFVSSENLCKDTFLRKNMDGEGWVPLSVIAGFNKVSIYLFCWLEYQACNKYFVIVYCSQ